MKKQVPIVIEDSKDTRNIIIQINLKDNTTTVFSSFSPWENLALLIEGLATTAGECVNEGMDKREVYKTIQDYIVKALPSYAKLIFKDTFPS